MAIKCGKYSAGDLKETVTFQRVTRVSDGAGGWTETWATLAGAPTRAMVRALSGGEAFRFDRVDATVRLMVVTRYSSAIKEADRVLVRGRAHNIRFINNLDFDDKWLEMAVDGGVAT
jgi:SPP1 family predicted phage head-tail adaptor